MMWPFHPGFHTPDLRVRDQVWRYANEQGSDPRGLGTLVKSHFWDLQDKMKERPISTPTAPTLPSVWEPQLYIPWHVRNGRKSNLFLLESLQFCTSADCMVNIFSLFSPIIFLNSNLVFLKWEKNTHQKKWQEVDTLYLDSVSYITNVSVVECSFGGWGEGFERLWESEWAKILWLCEIQRVPQYLLSLEFVLQLGVGLNMTAFSTLLVGILHSDPYHTGQYQCLLIF